jgi:hypothetical protein
MYIYIHIGEEAARHEAAYKIIKNHAAIGKFALRGAGKDKGKHMYIYLHIFTSVYMHIYINIHVYLFIYIYIYIHMCMHIKPTNPNLPH